MTTGNIPNPRKWQQPTAGIRASLEDVRLVIASKGDTQKEPLVVGTSAEAGGGNQCRQRPQRVGYTVIGWESSLNGSFLISRPAGNNTLLPSGSRPDNDRSVTTAVIAGLSNLTFRMAKPAHVPRRIG